MASVNPIGAAGFLPPEIPGNPDRQVSWEDATQSIRMEAQAAPSDFTALRECLERCLESVLEKRAIHLLLNWEHIDLRDMTAEDLGWIEQDWMARLAASGLPSLVVIVPTESFSRFMLPDLFRKIKASNTVLSYFDSLALGREWISRKISRKSEKPEVIFQSPFYSFSWDEEKSIVLSESHTPTSVKYRFALEKAMEFTRQKHPLKWLADSRHMGILSSESTDFVRRVFRPRLVEDGLRFWAYVLPEEAYAQNLIRQNVATSVLSEYTVAYFKTVEAAWIWLQLQQPKDTVQPVAEVGM